MKFLSLLNLGTKSSVTEIEVATFFQIPSFHLVGLPSKEIAEARERVRSAIIGSELSFPRKKIVVNLSPASIHKSGTHLDLAIALSILSTENQSRSCHDDRVLASGELSLEGSIRPPLQPLRVLVAALENGISKVILGEDNSYFEHLTLLEKISPIERWPKILLAKNLKDAWKKINHPQYWIPLVKLSSTTRRTTPVTASTNDSIPLRSYQERLLGVSAAGGHHLLLLGPKGTGKSTLLEILGQIRPVSKAQSLQKILMNELCPNSAGEQPPSDAQRVDPFCSLSSLIGQIHQNTYRPGAMALAHGSLLIADEILEWRRDAREALREPLERGAYLLQRRSLSLHIPSQFQLGASANPCPCGNWDLGLKMGLQCHCGRNERLRYFKRLSFALLDRIDWIHLIAEKNLPTRRVHLAVLREQVLKTQSLLQRSLGKLPSRLSPQDLNELRNEHPCWKKELHRHSLKSIRSKEKCLRVALTLGAWDGVFPPRAHHFWEAAAQRPEKILPESFP